MSGWLLGGRGCGGLSSSLVRLLDEIRLSRRAALRGQAEVDN
jgi:hypothetical protein